MPRSVAHGEAPRAPAESSLYRRVWRWHFYAGLVCLPFLALMAITGALYLFKDPLENLAYQRLFFVTPPSAPGLAAASLVAKAQAAEPGTPVRFVAPARAGRSAEVGIRTPEGIVAVYLDPASGQVLGRLRDELRLMEVVKRIHSLAIAGPVANHWIEIVAGWAIVLVVSGVSPWWPRGRGEGVYRVRGRPAQRTWWRDVHAITGVTAAAAILFLAVTGMPWSAFWGERFGRITSELGVGLPKYLWGQPESAQPLASIGDVPWTLTQAALPESGAHAHHGGAAPLDAPAVTAQEEIGLDRALAIFTKLGVAAGTPVSLPAGPRGVYTAMQLPDDVTAQRVVHLDRYSGAVLADVHYADYGLVGRGVEWGISIHTGRQFGWINQLVMLAGCLAILALAATAAVMWWKRRPRGRLAAPPRRDGDRAAGSAIAVAIFLGLLYPLLGASMLLALLVDALVPRRWHERFGL